MFSLHFCDCSLSFSCEIKLLYVLAFLLLVSLNGCYDKLCTIKWFDFCLSITLRDIFKWLMKGAGANVYIKKLFKHLAIAAYCVTRLLNQ